MSNENQKNAYNVFNSKISSLILGASTPCQSSRSASLTSMVWRTASSPCLLMPRLTEDQVMMMMMMMMVMRSQGPDNTTLSVDGFYYHRKLDHLERITRWMNCDPSPAPYHTHMDGEEGWACQAGDIFCTNKSEFVNTLHSGCKVLTPGSGVGRL